MRPKIPFFLRSVPFRTSRHISRFLFFGLGRTGKSKFFPLGSFVTNQQQTLYLTIAACLPSTYPNLESHDSQRLDEA
jgi:hypothetical protein